MMINQVVWSKGGRDEKTYDSYLSKNYYIVYFFLYRLIINLEDKIVFLKETQTDFRILHGPGG